jgi:hypothetical protein
VIQTTVSIETDPETGDTRVAVGVAPHISAVYKSPEITNSNDSTSLDNGFVEILEAIDSEAHYKIVNKLTS